MKLDVIHPTKKNIYKNIEIQGTGYVFPFLTCFMFYYLTSENFIVFLMENNLIMLSQYLYKYIVNYCRHK